MFLWSVVTSKLLMLWQGALNLLTLGSYVPTLLMLPSSRYDDRRADFAVNFISMLKHTRGKWYGKPFQLMWWQERIVRDVFGTVDKDGYRQFSTAYVEVAKKNGKSELAAAIALYLLYADGEIGAEVYSCAGDINQASIVFNTAKAMVEQCNDLAKLSKLVPSTKRIIFPHTSSFYRVLSSETKSKHGFNVHGVVFDELHAQPNRELYDVMSFGSGDARRQPLYWYITTAGKDPDRTSIGWELHQKAVDILLGHKSDATFYPVVFSYDPEERRVWHGWGYKQLDELATWESEDIWRMVNPSLGHTIKFETVREVYQAVKGNPASEQLFQQLRLNVWVKHKHAKWLLLEVWDANGGQFDLEELKGRKCFGGLDLSSKLDVSAFVLIFPPEQVGGKYIVLPFFWIPEDNIEQRVKRDKVNYDQWTRQRLLTATPGNVIDYNFIRQTIIGLRDAYDIQEIGFDPWNAMQLAVDLGNEGLTMVEIRQGYKSMSPPMKELEAYLRGGHINHGNNPILRWMFGNLEVRVDENDNIRPVKGKGIERIDGIVALINALARMILREKPQRSIYEDQGLDVL
ncbi:MAG: hypothetical protein DDT19_01054 [Syntrophomonadaceae bacterium]|nr:hypothetical protein [Bacillota bacterium]